MPVAATIVRMGCFPLGIGARLMWTDMWGFVVNVSYRTLKAKWRLNGLCASGLRDRLGELKNAARMPRSVTRALTVGQGAKRGRSESRDGEETRCSG
jgi:hypothetical protein